MNLELKHLELKASLDVAPDGSFSGYAAVFGNVDENGDRIVSGAFAADVRERGGRRPLLYQHQMDVPIGYVDLIEDSKGLRIVRGQMVLDVEEARNARALIKSGSIDGLSIGFQTLRDRIARDRVRELVEVRVFEVSVVTVPANPKAKIDAVKSSAFVEFLENVSDAKRKLKASAADRAAERQARKILDEMRAMKASLARRSR